MSHLDEFLTIKGKNLFDKNSMVIVGRVEADGTIIPSSPSASIVVPVVAGKTYTLQYEHADGDTNVVGRLCFFSEYPSSTSVVGFNITTRGKGLSPYTFTTPANAKYFAWWASRSTQENINYCLNSIQLEEGSTATEYVPYKGEFKRIGDIWKRAIQKTTNKAQSIIFENTRRVSINLLNPNSIDYRLARYDQHLSYELIPQQQGVVYTISCSGQTGSNKDVYVQNRNGISDTEIDYTTVTNNNPVTIIGKAGYYIFVYASTSEASKDTFLQAQAKVTIYPSVFTPTKVMPNLKAFGGTVEERSIFKDYALLEYIESSGTQYIDTGYTMTNDNLKYELTIKDFVSKGAANFFIGYRSVNSAVVAGDMRSFFIYSDGRIAIRYGSFADNSTKKMTASTLNTITFDGTTVYVNGEDFISVTSKYQSPSYKPLYLLYANADGYYASDIEKLTCKLYGSKISQDDVLVRNYIPVKRLSDNAIGMYDLVEGKFYGNAGTGAFTAGPEIKPVEYIESSGTQYIDTELTAKNGFKFVASIYESNKNVSWQTLVGSHEAVAPHKRNFVGISNTPSSNPARTANALAIGIGDGERTSNGALETKRWYSIETCNEVNNKYLKVDNILVTNYYDSGTSEAYSERSLYLFANHNQSTDVPGTPFIGRIGSAKIYMASDLVRNYIPVLCGTEYCMYDLVEHKVYRNAGTGTFTGGSEVPWRLLYPYDLISNKGKLELGYDDGAIIPDEYDRVEYIESSGTQYIDTGITCKDTLSLSCKFQLTSSPDRNRMFGGRTGTSSYGNIEFITYNGQYYIMFGNQPERVISSQTSDTSVHIIDFKNGEQKLDNSILATESYTFSNNIPIYLFGIYNNGSAVIGTLKVFSFVVRDGNDLVRNFIPVKRKSDNVYGMYDTVTQQFYGNNGTGSFIGGAVIPRIIRANGEHKVLIDNVEVAEITEILPSITSYIDIQQGKLYKDWEVIWYDGTQTIPGNYISQTGDLTPNQIVVYELVTPTTDDIAIDLVALTTKGEKTLTSEAEIVCPVEATYLGM